MASSAARRGLTLIELLIAIGLFGAIASIAVNMVQQWARATAIKDAQQSALDRERLSLYNLANDIRVADYIYHDASVSLQVNVPGLGIQQLDLVYPPITYNQPGNPGSLATDSITFAILSGPSSASYVTYFTRNSGLWRVSWNWDNTGPAGVPAGNPFVTWYKFTQPYYALSRDASDSATSSLANWPAPRAFWQAGGPAGWGAIGPTGYPAAYQNTSQLCNTALTLNVPTAKLVTPLVNPKSDPPFVITNMAPASTTFLYSPAFVQIRLDVPFLGTGIASIAGQRLYEVASLSLPTPAAPGRQVVALDAPVDRKCVQYSRLATEVYAHNVQLP